MQTIAHPYLTPARLRRTAIIYIRQSSPGQVRDHTGSTDAQRAQEGLAKAYGFLDIKIIDEDLGRSGSATELRTGFHQVLADVASGTVGAVFAINASRLARKVAAVDELLTLCRYNDTVLVLDGQVRDPADPNDTLMVHVEGGFAEFHGGSLMRGMRTARLEKAKQGNLVVRLLTGFIEGPNKTIEFDPEAYDAIKEVQLMYWEVGSAYGTLAELLRKGKLLPVRRGKRLEWTKPTLDRVMRFLLHPAYAGIYHFGKTESAKNRPTKPNGLSTRRAVPSEQWITHQNFYPAYMTVEEQERIRAHMKERGFNSRRRPGRGAALAQGLLVCGTCGYTLTVADPRPRKRSHYYQCTVLALRNAQPSCMAIQGIDLDAAIERAILAALATPPLEVLLQALENEQSARATRQSQIESERQRLEFAEQRAQDFCDNIDPRNRLAAAKFHDRLEEALRAREDFEARVATIATSDEAITEVELRGLCDVVADIPSLWRHPMVTHKDRKEILRCLVASIRVSVTPELVTAIMMWRGGATTELTVVRRRGLEQRIGMLHAKGMSVPEISGWLAKGDPETGQRWERTNSAIYQTLKRLNLRPNPVDEEKLVDTERVQRLYDSGMTLEGIAEHLNAEGSRTPRKRLWTQATVWHWLNATGRREQLEKLHYAALLKAKCQGLSNRQAAAMFNAECLPRERQKTWTADVVRQRRTQLTRRMQRKATDAAAQQPTEPRQTNI